MARLQHLRGLLQAHPTTDALEADFVQQMLALCDASADPFARDHWDPGHFTASAFVLSADGQSLLLILHGKLNRWLQPGGHVEPGDVDVLAAALREVAEETDITDAEVVGAGLLDVDIHVIPAMKGNPAHKHFDVRILLRARSDHYAAGDDAVDARWVRLEDINAVESDASVMRAVSKLMTR